MEASCTQPRWPSQEPRPQCGGACPPSALRQAGPSADLGACDIYTVFCADFHATCNNPRIFGKNKWHTHHIVSLSSALKPPGSVLAPELCRQAGGMAAPGPARGWEDMPVNQSLLQCFTVVTRGDHVTPATGPGQMLLCTGGERVGRLGPPGSLPQCPINGGKPSRVHHPGDLGRGRGCGSPSSSVPQPQCWEEHSWFTAATTETEPHLPICLSGSPEAPPHFLQNSLRRGLPEVARRSASLLRGRRGKAGEGKRGSLEALLLPAHGSQSPRR